MVVIVDVVVDGDGDGDVHAVAPTLAKISENLAGFVAVAVADNVKVNVICGE